MSIARETATVQNEHSLQMNEKIGYGIGDLASNLVFAAIGAFMTFFYTDVAGIAAASIATIMLVSRIFDGFSDIVMGILMDRTRTKHGKARPWLLWMAIPFAISAVLLFTVPPFGMTGKLIYAFVTYNLMSTIVYTAINIPYGALNSLITQDQYQRTVLNIFRMFFAIVGNIVVIAGTLPLVDALGGGARGWQLTFLIYGIISACLFVITFRSTSERVGDGMNLQADHVPVKIGVQALLKNKYWAMMVGVALTTYIGQGLSGAGIYFYQYILGDAKLVGPMGLVSMLPMIIGMGLVAPFVKRYGKRNVALLGSIVSLIGIVITAMAPANLPVLITGLAIKSLGMGPLAASYFAMIADTIEYGEWRSGVRTEGLVYSAGSFGTKMGAGIGVALIGWILSFGGYVAGQSVQPQSAVLAINTLFIYIPLVLTIIQILILYFYHLDREFPDIIAALQKKQSA